MTMAEPALILTPATQAVAVRSNQASGGRRTIPSARLRCRVEATPDQADAAAQAATDYTDFSMVGVAG